MTQDNGGPAFPHAPEVSIVIDGYKRVTPGDEPGMTLRDYFAAKVLPALVNEPQWSETGRPTVLVWSADYVGDYGPERYAFAAYKMADAMLAARAAQ